MAHPETGEDRGERRSHGNAEGLRIEAVLEREGVGLNTETNEFQKDIRRDRGRDDTIFHLLFNVEEDVVKGDVSEETHHVKAQHGGGGG